MWIFNVNINPTWIFKPLTGEGNENELKTTVYQQHKISCRRVDDKTVAGDMTTGPTAASFLATSSKTSNILLARECIHSKEQIYYCRHVSFC